ncbi:hypothetical protein [Rhodococcus sp. T7]|uniref:hypothetical protein n=1 Tax=Rhodococcus sp. T7 TaxID=627444 RepID=UPI00135B0997|nr:hypothetical protein [Rhodococcus sp. T7]KAF0957219.1 hypothetical protein MLGJGCBP_09049 [Rhodococcus sp. T7]KAF0966823.1 hypothetical protein MLGJGCBP_00018 [Rhodococcus sp. T7]
MCGIVDVMAHEPPRLNHALPARIQYVEYSWLIGDGNSIVPVGESTRVVLAQSDELLQHLQPQQPLSYSGAVEQPWPNWRSIRETVGASTAPSGGEDTTAPAVLHNGPLQVFFVSALPVPAYVELRGPFIAATPGLDTPIDAPATTGVITRLQKVTVHSQRTDVGPDRRTRWSVIPGTALLSDIEYRQRVEEPPRPISSDPDGNRCVVDLGVLVDLRPDKPPTQF